MTHTLDPSDRPAHATAETAAGQVRGCAAALSPKPRLVLVSTLTTHQDPEPAPRAAGPGAPEIRPASRNDPPDAVIRLRFADATALERAEAAFGSAGTGPGLGDACGDRSTLTLQISGDAGIETLRTVLAILDAAAIPAESLTVHTHELDDVFAAFTSLS